MHSRVALSLIIVSGMSALLSAQWPAHPDRSVPRTADGKENPDAHCLPMGLMQFHMHP